MRLSIVLPSFNEPRAHETLRECKRLFPDAQIIISPDKIGRGKGWAVRKGLFAAEGDVIVFLDSDGDIAPRMILRLLPFLSDYDIVVGCKGIGGMPLSRKLITIASRIYIKLLFWIDVDTQSGLKAMRHDAVAMWEANYYLFDVEFLARAKIRGKRMVEVPIEAKITKGKSLGVLWEAFLESLRIWFLLLSQRGKKKT